VGSRQLGDDEGLRKEIYRQAVEGVGGNELALTVAAEKRGRGRV
jgi:hypothetical protein